MIIPCLIIIIGLTLILIVMNLIFEDSMPKNVFCVIILVVLILICLDYNETPKAMDVYQHKTTLKYTIVDGVKTDSIVVFKNK